jgi:hypothetical protein
MTRVAGQQDVVRPQVTVDQAVPGRRLRPRRFKVSEPIEAARSPVQPGRQRGSPSGQIFQRQQDTSELLRSPGQLRHPSVDVAGDQQGPVADFPE